MSKARVARSIYCFCRTFSCKRQAVLLFGKNYGIQTVIHVFSPALVLRQGHPTPLVRVTQHAAKKLRENGLVLPVNIGSEEALNRLVLEREESFSSTGCKLPFCDISLRRIKYLGFPRRRTLCIELLGPIVTWVEIVPSLWAKVGPRGCR